MNKVEIDWCHLWKIPCLEPLKEVVREKEIGSSPVEVKLHFGKRYKASPTAIRITDDKTSSGCVGYYVKRIMLHLLPVEPEIHPYKALKLSWAISKLLGAGIPQLSLETGTSFNGMGQWGSGADLQNQ